MVQIATLKLYTALFVAISASNTYRVRVFFFLYLNLYYDSLMTLKEDVGCIQVNLYIYIIHGDMGHCYQELCKKFQQHLFANQPQY